MLSYLPTRAKPGAALQAPPSLNNYFIEKLTDGLWKYIYGAATPLWLKMVISVIKETIFEFLRRF